SWNHATWPISQRIGFTMGRSGPIHRASSRSVTRASVRARASRRSAARGSIFGAAEATMTAVRIALVCPAPAGSRLGNRITALRWQRMLRELGHTPFIDEELGPRRHDVLVALHARRSAAAVFASRERHPGRPIVVALTGTDLYRDIHHDADALRS